MGLLREDVVRFQEIYKKETGNDISYEEALESATSLVEMIRLVYKPIKKIDYEKYKNKQ
jgi:hypothetical protein